MQEARAAVTSQVSLPSGYFMGWSGRYENQEHARQRLLAVVPIVLVVIFVLLYFTYHSALEALHVLLAVPFALTGGVFLVWLLGYNFSVAVWVGFIALFGTAVQTAVVMVIYLEEAVARRRAADAGRLSRAALREAVIEGALLRLRPKVMTVSTVVAGLLPIMWSARVGAEVMKPLAAPVLGGMVSSLLLVLVVTPVLFFRLRERDIDRDAAGERPRVEEGTGDAVPPRRRRTWIWIACVAIITAIAVGGWWYSQSASAPDAGGRVFHTVRTGEVVITLLSDDGVLRQGRNIFAIEFRSAATNALLDVGDVRFAAAMTMPGMAMSGGAEIGRTSVPGRYAATGEFGMAGNWRMTIEWNGPAGHGSATVDGDVR